MATSRNFTNFALHKIVLFRAGSVLASAGSETLQKYFRGPATFTSDASVVKDDVSISPSEALRACQRHIGLVSLPEDIQQELEETLRADTMKQLRLHGVALVKQLRKQSRTSAKGGVLPRPLLEPNTGLRPRPLQRSQAQRLREMELVEKSEEDLNRELILSEVLRYMKPKQRRAVAAADRSSPGSRPPAEAPVYIDRTVAAYAANRLPSTYAAVFRVLSELSAVLPGFSPAKV
eukprot:CAMPEP_0177612080 /NCGR_PEP_ID=MMETSP0419_2-20121207/20968_1 /TAXON_ID=582737 /ORGANISM="Tetraselmis sp., Strain GSL018" /LENGTH=233 /DNA_ID=CAMNT_0019108121 /DNA_START=82 /DNA_END=779 /DNA_ORIENTATION=+